MCMLINMYYLFDLHKRDKEGVFLKEKLGVPINIINANRFVFNNFCMLINKYLSDDET